MSIINKNEKVKLYIYNVYTNFKKYFILSIRSNSGILKDTNWKDA